MRSQVLLIFFCLVVIWVIGDVLFYLFLIIGAIKQNKKPHITEKQLPAAFLCRGGQIRGDDPPASRRDALTGPDIKKPLL